MRTRHLILTAVGVVSTIVLGATLFSQGAKTQWPAMESSTRRTAQESLNKGLEYLRKNQKPNGSWEMHEGITGLAAIAFMKQPGDWKKDQAYVDKALKYIVALAKSDGSIYSKDMAAVNTAIAIMAFQQSGKPEYRTLIKKGQDYLIKAQFDEGEGIKPSDKNYGGIGYDDESRADLSNLHHVLEALKETSLPKDSALWDKAIQFIQRKPEPPGVQSSAMGCGGWRIHLYAGHELFRWNQVVWKHDLDPRSLSYNYANLKKTDNRVQDAYKWIRSNYTVDENPGLRQDHALLLLHGIRERSPCDG